MDELFIFPQSLLLAAAALLPAVLMTWLLRKRLRSQRHAHRVRMLRLEASSPDAIFRTDHYGRIRAFNAESESLFGYHEEEVLGKHIRTIFPDVTAGGSALNEQSLEGLRARSEDRWIEVPALGKSGITIPVQIRVSNAGDERRPVYLAYIRNLTQKKELAQSAAEKNFLANLLQAVGVPIAVLSSDGKLTRCNPAFEELTGCDHKAAVGKFYWELALPEAEWGNVRTWIADLLTRQKAQKSTQNWHTFDGASLKVCVAASPLGTDQVVMAAYEVPAAAPAQTSFHTMDALERLAAGMAKEFNNLLTPVSGYGELLLYSMEDGDPLKRDVEEIKKAADRATALASQLLVFGRKHPMRTEVFNLNDLVNHMRPMLETLLGEKVKLGTVLDLELGKLSGDPGWMEQAILNLAVNARDAMLNGGKLSIETSNATFDATSARHAAQLPEGNYVVLTVSDSGAGMAKTTADQATEPFFAAVPDGTARGMGLGLSTVQGVVKQYGGNVVIQSVPGSGTRVQLYMPRHEDTEQPEKKSGVMFLVRGASAGS
ncbi:MAG: PAS domain S-box protein [Candidatus Solibacter usitatus]|nr:PAS domain S-box protein [Candidatus Solibacter usitatus]